MAIYRLTAEAADDLNRIWLYGAQKHGEVQADAYFYSFFKHFEKLAQQPYLYPAVDDIRPGYRRSVCGVDSVYYRVIEDGVEIMRILGHQDSHSRL